MSLKRWAITLLCAIGAAAVVIGAVALAQLLTRGVSARTAPTVAEAWLARSMRRLAMNELRRERNPLPVTPELLTQARAHWADHCAGCHGNDGRGDTPMGRNLYPPAPDMRGAETQGLTDGELYGVIENGVRMTGMPAWGDGKRDNAGSWGLVAFVRHLPEQPAAEAEAMKALNPVSAHELSERADEDAFLSGEAAPPDAGPHHLGEH